MAKTTKPATRRAAKTKNTPEAAPDNKTDAPPMLTEERFGAYRVTSSNTLIYGFGPKALDLTPTLKAAGAPTDRAHLVALAGSLKTLAFTRQGLTERSMTQLRMAIGRMQAAQLPLS